MVAVPAVEAVNMLVHVAVPAVVPAAKAHVVNVPVTPLTVNATDAVGGLTGAGETSVTVALQFDAWLTNTGLVHVTVAVQVEPCAITTGLVQVTAVVVVRRLTTTLAAVVVVLVA